MNVKAGARNIAVIALMSALLIAGKFALSFVPNVEVVTLFVVLFSCVFGLSRTLPAVLIFCLLDNVIYPPSLDVTIQYFVHWPLLCLASSLVGRRTRNEFVFLGVVALFSVLFWIETPVIGRLLGFYLFLPTLIGGILFFIINLVANCALILIVFRPLVKVLEKCRNKLFPLPPNV